MCISTHVPYVRLSQVHVFLCLRLFAKPRQAACKAVNARLSKRTLQAVFFAPLAWLGSVGIQNYAGLSHT